MLYWLLLAAALYISFNDSPLSIYFNMKNVITAKGSMTSTAMICHFHSSRL